MSLFDDIKAAYPAPVKHDGGTTTGYCVGGACLMYGMLTTNTLDLPHSYRFPDEAQLADQLFAYNPHLGEDEIFSYACSIIAENDKGHFSAAWLLLQEALDRP